MEAGVDKFADAVRGTRSARGAGNVVLAKAFGGPTVTNDGVTIARDIDLEDHQEENLRPVGQVGGDQDRRCRR